MWAIAHVPQHEHLCPYVHGLDGAYFNQVHVAPSWWCIHMHTVYEYTGWLCWRVWEEMCYKGKHRRNKHACFLSRGRSPVNNLHISLATFNKFPPLQSLTTRTKKYKHPYYVNTIKQHFYAWDLLMQVKHRLLKFLPHKFYHVIRYNA